MTDQVYNFFIQLLKSQNSFASQQEANEFLFNFTRKHYKKQTEINAFTNKFKIILSGGKFEIKPKINSVKNLEMPIDEIELFLKKGNFFQHRALKREVDFSKFKLKPERNLTKQELDIINAVKNQILKERKQPLIIIQDKKVIQGLEAIYALKQLGYKKFFVILIKEKGAFKNISESKELTLTDLKTFIELNLNTYVAIIQDALEEKLTENKEEFSKVVLNNIGYIIKHNNPNLSIFLETENTEGESYQLYVTDWKDVISIYLPYINYYHKDYKVTGDDVEINKMSHPDLLFFNSLGKNIGEYEQIVEGRTYKMTGEKKALYDFIVSLNSQFVEKAQQIYDEWEQDEEGYDEVLGSGGICQDIAEEMGHIFNENNHNARYNCYSSGENFDFHVVLYVYFDPEYLTGDEEEDEELKILFEVDIPYDTYESGGGFTWTKKPDVKFDDSMILISDLSPYYDNYILNRE